MTADAIIDALEKCKQSFTPATYWYKNIIKAIRFIKKQNAEIARLQQTQDDIDNFARIALYNDEQEITIEERNYIKELLEAKYG